MATIGVIQMQDDGPPGLLGEWANGRRGVELDVRHLSHGEPLPGPGTVAAVAVLGSSASVNDLDAPRRDELRDWLAGMLALDVPALGICFGAQLLASVLGAPVTRLAAPEIGWTTVTVDDPEVTTGPWFEWHEDTIGTGDALRVIAHNARGTQAFRSGPGNRHLGVQFHPEVTPTIVADWIRADDGDLAAAGVRAGDLRQATLENHEHAIARARALFDTWWRRARRVSAPSRALG